MRWISFLVSILIFGQSKSQVKVLEVPAEGFRKALVYDDNSSGDIVVTLINVTGIKRYLIYNDTTKKTEEIRHASRDEEYKIASVYKTAPAMHHAAICLTGLQKDSLLLELFNKPNSFNYVFTLMDLKTDKILKIDTLRTIFPAHPITFFSQNDYLYLVFYKYNTNELIIYKKSIETEIETLRLKISVPKVKLGSIDYGARIKTLKDYFEKGSSVILNDNLPCPTQFGIATKKIFLQNNKLLFSMITSKYQAYIVSVDLLTGKHQDYEVGLEDITVSGVQVPASLHIVDSILILGYIRNEEISLKLHNYLTSQPLKSITINKENFDELSKDSLIKKRFIGNGLTNISFEKFLTLAKGNNLAVSAYKKDGQLIINLGANYERSTPLQFALSVLMTAYATYAINSLPDTYGLGLFYFYQYGGDNNVSFNTVLNSNFEISDNAPEENATKSLIRFISEKKISNPESKIFVINHRYYLGYFDKLTKLYSLYRF